MNVIRTSEKKDFLNQIFFDSLFYTFPIGMFLTACNFMFESVEDYFFDWWIVVLPTVAVLIFGNLYEMFWVYQRNSLFTKKQKSFGAKPVGYVPSSASLTTS